MSRNNNKFSQAHNTRFRLSRAMYTFKRLLDSSSYFRRNFSLVALSRESSLLRRSLKRISIFHKKVDKWRINLVRGITLWKFWRLSVYFVALHDFSVNSKIRREKLRNAQLQFIRSLEIAAGNNWKSYAGNPFVNTFTALGLSAHYIVYLSSLHSLFTYRKQYAYISMRIS